MMRPTNEELKQLFGNTAIVEGQFTVPDGNIMMDLMGVIEPKIIITEAYYDHNNFKKLVEENIETILIETTFTYEDKIFDAAAAIVKLIETTGWKPKRVVNTMDFGLDKLFLMCHQFDIELFRIADNLEYNSKLNQEFELKKIQYEGFNLCMIQSKYGDAFIFDKE